MDEEEEIEGARRALVKARAVQDKITVMLLVDPEVLEQWLLEMHAARCEFLARSRF